MIASRIVLSQLCRMISIAIGICGLIGCGSAPIAAPTEFADYNSPGGTFACEYPKNWEADGGGKRGLEWAKFKSGPAEIKIDAGAAASLMAGPSGGFTGEIPQEEVPELEPIHGLHQAFIKDAEKAFSGYKEVGNIEVIDIALGPARRSEFTASSTFGSGWHGYRATALGKDKGLYIYCVCHESDWKTLQPAFDKVLRSLRRGQAE